MMHKIQFHAAVYHTVVPLRHLDSNSDPLHWEYSLISDKLD